MIAVPHPFEPEDVMAYLDAELPDARAALVEQHLKECAECQGVAGGLRQVSTRLASWDVGQPRDMRAPAGTASARSLKAFLWGGFSAVRVTLAAGVVACFLVLWIGQTVRPDGNRALRMSAAEGGARVSATSPPPPIKVGGEAGLVAPNAVDKLEPLSQQPPEPPGAEARRAARIVRTVSLSIVVKDVAAARSGVERVLQDVGGFVGTIELTDDGDIRGLRATLRVPSVSLDGAIASLRSLGRVTAESRGGDDVTEQLVDISARLANARNTERRLTEVLKSRTGNVRDVLEVEREIGRVRGEIEKLDAQQKNLDQRVTYATVTLAIAEERKARLDSDGTSLGTELRNALVDGLRDAYGSATGTALILLRAAPALLFWVAILWWPARKGYRAWQTATKPAVPGP
jgi:Domain of unknown function (DUF4349)/Putative zinc-finger